MGELERTARAIVQHGVGFFLLSMTMMLAMTGLPPLLLFAMGTGGLVLVVAALGLLHSAPGSAFANGPTRPGGEWVRPVLHLILGRAGSDVFRALGWNRLLVLQRTLLYLSVALPTIGVAILLVVAAFG